MRDAERLNKNKLKDFLSRLKPKRNLPSVIGWTLIILEMFGKLMDVVDFVRVAQLVWYFIPKASQFLTSGLGTLLVILTGLVLIGYGDMLHGRKPPHVNTEEAHSKENQRQAEILKVMILGDSPEKCLLVRPMRVQLQHINDSGGPYIVFDFHVYNASICTVKFDKATTGHLIYKGQELKDTLEFPPGSLKPQLKRLESAQIELRQFLLPEIASTILDNAKAKKERIEFDFYLVKLPIDITWPSKEAGRIWDFPFPRKVSFEWPTDGLFAYP